MKIGAFCRTLNEEQNISGFIESHWFCDTICISDGGSTDKTIEIASSYQEKVKIRHFDNRIYLSDGTYYNHESLHYSELIQWSMEEGITWAVFDDADHVCNKRLQHDARDLLESNRTPFAYALLMYVWGLKEYFPDLNPCCPQERLWAWNVKEWMPDLNTEHPTTLEIRNQPDADSIDKLVLPHPPYVVRHYSWLTEEITRRKMAFNAARGVLQLYPPDTCGQLLPIPAWAY